MAAELEGWNRWNTLAFCRDGALAGAFYAAYAPNCPGFWESGFARWLDSGGAFGAALYSSVSFRFYWFGFGVDPELLRASTMLGGAALGAIVFGAMSGLRNVTSER